MVCPQCETAYEHRIYCPQCNVHLTDQAPRGGSQAVRLAWKQTPWGWMLVGLVLAQGLYYGLRHLGTAALLIGGDGVSKTLTDLVLIQGLQAIGVFAAGLLGGAGRQKGILYGALIGLMNGLVFMVFETNSSKPLSMMEFFGPPFLLTVIGAAGGLGGILICKPPTLSRGAAAPAAKQARADKKDPARFGGKIAWFRVLLGIFVAVSGTVLVSIVLKWILETSKGELSISSELQAQVVTCEICVLMMLVGSGLAGATTGNGIKQGVLVGLGSGILLVGLSLASAHTAVKLFSFTVTAGGDAASLVNLILIVASAVSLGLVGGWFGGDLFPPVVPREWKPFRSAPT